MKSTGIIFLLVLVNILAWSLEVLSMQEYMDKYYVEERVAIDEEIMPGDFIKDSGKVYTIQTASFRR